MKSNSIINRTTALIAAMLLLAGCSESQTDDDPARTEPRMILLEENTTLASKGGPFTVELQCNVDYEILLPDQPDWLRETSAGTEAPGIHRFQADPNETYDNRSTRIVFANTQFGLSQTFTLTQMQKDAILVADETIPIEARGGTLDFEVNTNVDFQVTISEAWIRQSPDARGLTKQTLHFTVDPNSEAEPRQATIRLTAGEIEQTVTIEQEGLGEQTWIRILHTNTDFRTPLVSGPDFRGGIISWGDGSQEEYRDDATHSYPTAGSHTVTLEMRGAETLTLPDLVGISELDLSQF